MVVHGYLDITQLLWMVEGGFRTNHYRLTYYGSPFANHAAFDFTIVRPPELAPFTATLKLSPLLFEQDVVARGIYLIDTHPGVSTLFRAYQFHPEALLLKQPDISSHKPG
jgi:hypothetical protein